MAERSDGFVELEERFADYTLRDPDGDKIGDVDALFMSETDDLEYVGVKMGFLGRKSTLIPMEVATIDDGRRMLTVSEEKTYVKDGPSFDDDQEITPEFEREVRSYYGLETAGERGGYGTYYDEEGANDGEGNLRDEDELRVQRSEEELRAGTREREAGRIGVRKRVRTERERIRVPTRREEVSVDRMPVQDRDVAEAEIGEEEVSMPVVEEEIVTDKRAAVKEEIRVHKDVVADEEVVEADLRKEEVDVEDATERHGR